MAKADVGSGIPDGSDFIMSGVVLLALTAVSVLPLTTPPPSAAANPTEFAVERALEHVANIALEPHSMGSAAGARVRDYLIAELAALGLEAELQSVTVPDYFGGPESTVELVNVMARLPGDDSTKAVALVGHYDTVPTTLGANDNAAAVAAILETARVLRAGPGLRNDVVLLFTDGEEPAPRYGSSAFVAEHPWADEVGFVMNFEAVGGSGPSMLVETNEPERWVIDGFATAASYPVAFSFLTETVDLLGGVGTDFEPFRAANIPGLNFAYLRGSPIYHTFNDSVERVDPGSLRHHGSYALSLARHFGNTDLDQPPVSQELAYFTVARSQMVRYPVGWALPLAVMVAVLFVVVSYGRVRRGEQRFASLLKGVGAVALGVFLAVLAATLVWKVFSGLRQTPAVGESYAYLLGLLALAGGIGAATRRTVRMRWGDVDEAGSAVLVWVILAVITSALIPGAGYLFVWPALGGSIALLWRPGARPKSRWGPLVPLVLVALPTLVLLVPAVDTFFQLAQPRPGNPDSEVAETVAVAIFLAVLAVTVITSVGMAQIRTNLPGLPGR